MIEGKGGAAGLALLLAVACGGSESPDPPDSLGAPRNLLLISIDTLRADRLGCYGYERDTSPVLDAFAREAIVFRDVASSSPWTIPSHVTMLSGMHPARHGVELPTQVAAAEVTMLAEVLADAGWYGFAITDGGWLTEERGFARGFRSYHDDDQSFAKTLEEAIAYFRHRTPKGAWFGFLHTYDVHCPYDPAEPFRSMFRDPTAQDFAGSEQCGNPHLNAMELNEAQARAVSDRYDGSVREMDAALASFFAHLDESGLLENTVVVITSDHGEEFLEHGRIGHEQSVHRELLQVPLIVRAPGFTPAVIDTPVELVDVMPTLLELLGLEAEREGDGRSLVPLMRGERGEGRARLATLRWKRTLDSWTTADAHLIVDRERDEARLFDRFADAAEQADRSAIDPVRVETLRAELDAALEELRARRIDPEEKPPASEEELRDLERLGYGGR